MKRKYVFIIYLIVIFFGCNDDKRQPDLSVSLEVLRKTDCYKMCYQLKVAIINNTDKKVYIPIVHLTPYLFIIDSSGRNVTKEYLKEELEFFLEHVTPRLINSELVQFDSMVEMNYDTNQIHYKHKEGAFNTLIDEAVSQEMGRLTRNNIELRNNIAGQEYLKDFFKSMYENVILLEPNSREYELLNINTLIKAGSKYKVFFRYRNANIPHLFEIKIPGSKEKIKFKGELLEKVKGYSLFVGELASDTLIIKKN